MKILKSDKKEGYVNLEVENKDDLWYLKDIIKEGDELKAQTMRTMLDGREKKKVTLGLEAEKDKISGKPPKGNRGDQGRSGEHRDGLPHLQP